ncbi:MAG: AAA family ATPase [Proteobacteria bacterium]|nr:AAA family ATPase [Pseudomonadota bacterium]
MIWVLTGPESSGKSTLARAIADHMGWPAYAEQARTYLQQSTTADGPTGATYLPSDLLNLVQIQQQMEAAVSPTENIILDTDLLTLSIWWQDKYGPLPPIFQQAWAEQLPRFYLLCRPDLPWQRDPLRENPHDRDRLFDLYAQALVRRQCDFAVCEGINEARLACTLAHERRREAIIRGD